LCNFFSVKALAFLLLPNFYACRKPANETYFQATYLNSMCPRIVQVFRIQLIVLHQFMTGFFRKQELGKKQRIDELNIAKLLLTHPFFEVDLIVIDDIGLVDVLAIHLHNNSIFFIVI
jgi:hypothetical protein